MVIVDAFENPSQSSAVYVASAVPTNPIEGVYEYAPVDDTLSDPELIGETIEKIIEDESTSLPTRIPVILLVEPDRIFPVIV